MLDWLFIRTSWTFKADADGSWWFLAICSAQSNIIKWATKKASIDCLNKGVVLQHFCEREILVRQRSPKIAKVKLLRERSRKLISVFFFMTFWTLFVKFWNKREHTLMPVYDCNFPCGNPNFPKNPRKHRKRSAKGPRKMQWSKSTSPPSKSLCLRPHFCGENPMFPFFFFPVLFLYIPFLLLRWADEVCEETVGKHIANACQYQT